MNVFGVGPAEATLVFVIALIVVGPQRFPEIARQAGRWYRIARRFTDEVMTDVRVAVDEIDKEAGASMGLSSVRDLVQIGDLSKEIEGAKADAVSASAAVSAAATVDLDAAATPATVSTTPEATTPATDAAVAEQPVALTEAASPEIASPEAVVEPSAETDEQRAAREAAAAAAAARVLSRATGDGA